VDCWPSERAKNPAHSCRAFATRSCEVGPNDTIAALAKQINQPLLLGNEPVDLGGLAVEVFSNGTLSVDVGQRNPNTS